MQTERLEIIRRTKLDLAQWIAAGMERCTNPATSLCLARYAAAQLESAALIPAGTINQKGRSSLLRNELGKSGSRTGMECVAVLTKVSRTMLAVLAASTPHSTHRGPIDRTVARLIAHEAQAFNHLRALSRG